MINAIAYPYAAKNKPYTVVLNTNTTEEMESIVNSVKAAVIQKYIGEYVPGAVAYATMTEAKYENMRAYYTRKMWESVALCFPSVVSITKRGTEQ